MFSKHSWIMQAEVSECGLACIAICASILGAEWEMSTLRRRFPSSQRGMSVDRVAAICGDLGLQARAVRCELEDLDRLELPAILHWGMNHYVVLEKLRRGKAHVLDPGKGPQVLDRVAVSRAFTGVALEVAAAPAFSRRKVRSPFNIWSLLRFRGKAATAIRHGLFFAVLLQLFVLAFPYFSQLAIDEAAVRADRSLLVVLAIGFGAVAVFRPMAELLRGIALQQASALIGWDMNRRLYRHMLRLPLGWFQSRKLSDVLSRQDSVDSIRGLITNGFVASIIDGCLAVSVLALMFLYSPVLTAVVAGAIVLQLGVKLASLPASMKLGMAALQASIAERGMRIETLRGMQSIKSMVGEATREGAWANRYAEVIGTTQANANFSISINAARSLVDGLCTVAIVYLGARDIMAGVMSIGAFFAFTAYKQQFTSSAMTFVDQMVAWRMAEMHSGRIADIALSPAEQGAECDPALEHALRGEVEVRRVFFRYSPSDPMVLSDISFTVAPGEFVAISGPSGCGKSTLAKIIAGLYPATSGSVLVDGSGLNPVAARTVRKHMGIVMQDDELFNGTLFENVAFFDERPSRERVWECLQLAALDDEVRQMPMQLETLVGDMGSALSGGQKQRLFLARALYRNPRILLLDEATANLDVASEARIHDALRALQVTRIVVSHRPSTLQIADRVIVLADGRQAGRPSRFSAPRARPGGDASRSAAPGSIPAGCAVPARGLPSAACLE